MSFWRMPLDAEEHVVVVGEVSIIAYRCKGCGFCIEFCPRDVLVESKDFNEKGYHPPIIVKPGECVDCNFCETICPEFAIFVTALDSKKLKASDVIKEETRRERRRRRSGPS